MRWIHALVLAPFAAFAFVADSMVDKHVSALQKAQSFTATLSVTKVGGSTEEVTLSFSKPDKFRWESPSSIVVSDGKTTYIYDKAGKLYTKSAADAAGTLKALGADAVWAWSPFFDAKFAEQVASTEKGNSRKLKNIAVTDLGIVRKDKRAFSLALDDALGVARGARYVTEENGAQVETIIIAKELTLGEATLADTLFAWTPPADAKDAAAAAAEKAANAMHFAEIKPIFDMHCTSCHGGRAPKDGIDLSTYANVMASRSVRPGNAEMSKLVRAIRSGKMPPGGPIPKDQVEKIAKWVVDGAVE
jgi:outer membrane lipoprotein-sorting protein